MALIGLSEAAKLTGKNRTTIFRAMKSGRLSYTVNDAGERRIDAAELERVFPATDADNNKSDATHVAVLAAQLEAERRNVHAQLTALLADKRESPAADPQPPATWPRRVLGWLAKQHRS